MPAGRPKLPPDERRVRLGLLVSPEARDRLRELSEERGLPQNRVVEDLILDAAATPPRKALSARRRNAS